MSSFLSDEILAGLAAARRLAASGRANRLRLRAGPREVPLLRLWPGGFSVPADAAPGLRGLVDVYDGGTLVWQCLIVASGEDDGEMRFEFKRVTPAMERAPRDFWEDPDRPTALIAGN